VVATKLDWLTWSLDLSQLARVLEEVAGVKVLNPDDFPRLHVWIKNFEVLNCTLTSYTFQNNLYSPPLNIVKLTNGNC
jgi:hypothetical protein